MRNYRSSSRFSSFCQFLVAFLTRITRLTMMHCARICLPRGRPLTYVTVCCFILPVTLFLIYLIERQFTVGKVYLRARPSSALENHLQWHQVSQTSIRQSEKLEWQELLDESKAIRSATEKTCQSYKHGHPKLSDLSRRALRYFIVDDQYKVIYCSMPKVACTNWKRVFLVLSGKLPNVTDLMTIKADDAHEKYGRAYLKTLKDYKDSEIEYRIKNYFKFSIVREPLERVLSAYRNKFYSKQDNYFKSRFGRRIVRRYRSGATRAEIHAGNVRLSEFVKLLLDNRTEEEGLMNEHWLQQHKLCHPCSVNYDFVARYSHLHEASKYILHRIGVDTRINFPARNATYKHPETAVFLLSFFATIPLTLVENLYEKYKKDYEYFGYPFPEFLGKLQSLAPNSSVMS